MITSPFTSPFVGDPPFLHLRQKVRAWKKEMDSSSARFLRGNLYDRGYPLSAPLWRADVNEVDPTGAEDVAIFSAMLEVLSASLKKNAQKDLSVEFTNIQGKITTAFEKTRPQGLMQTFLRKKRAPLTATDVESIYLGKRGWSHRASEKIAALQEALDLRSQISELLPFAIEVVGTWGELARAELAKADEQLATGELGQSAMQQLVERRSRIERALQASGDLTQRFQGEALQGQVMQSLLTQSLHEETLALQRMESSLQDSLTQLSTITAVDVSQKAAASLAEAQAASALSPALPQLAAPTAAESAPALPVPHSHTPPERNPAEAASVPALATMWFSKTGERINPSRRQLAAFHEAQALANTALFNESVERLVNLATKFELPICHPFMNKSGGETSLLAQVLRNDDGTLPTGTDRQLEALIRRQPDAALLHVVQRHFSPTEMSELAEAATRPSALATRRRSMHRMMTLHAPDGFAAKVWNRLAVATRESDTVEVFCLNSTELANLLVSCQAGGAARRQGKLPKFPSKRGSEWDYFAAAWAMFLASPDVLFSLKHRWILEAAPALLEDQNHLTTLIAGMVGATITPGAAESEVLRLYEDVLALIPAPKMKEFVEAIAVEFQQNGFPASLEMWKEASLLISEPLCASSPLLHRMVRGMHSVLMVRLESDEGWQPEKVVPVPSITVNVINLACAADVPDAIFTKVMERFPQLWETPDARGVTPLLAAMTHATWARAGALLRLGVRPGEDFFERAYAAFDAPKDGLQACLRAGVLMSGPFPAGAIAEATAASRISILVGAVRAAAQFGFDPEDILDRVESSIPAWQKEEVMAGQWIAAAHRTDPLAGQVLSAMAATRGEFVLAKPGAPIPREIGVHPETGEEMLPGSGDAELDSILNEPDPERPILTGSFSMSTRPR